jgi:hypothetical protein
LTTFGSKDKNKISEFNLCITYIGYLKILKINETKKYFLTISIWGGKYRMKYNEYDILEAKINKNLIGDTVILKPTNSKTGNMPT